MPLAEAVAAILAVELAGPIHDEIRVPDCAARGRTAEALTSR